MTLKSQMLLNGLTDALFEKKALLLTGNSGVGKTYMAKQAAYELKRQKYNVFNALGTGKVIVEVISCHNSVTYEDVVGGISADTRDGNMVFGYKEKIFLQMLTSADADYNKKIDNRYVLIMDDIQRNDFPSLIGDATEAIGVESKKKTLSLNNGQIRNIPPNFYVIATYNPAENEAVPISKDLVSNFYIVEILSDISYITEDKESDNAIWYDQIRSLIFNYLDMQYRSSTYEQNKYLPGHGYFAGDNLAYKIKLQLIPLLKQYISEGILDISARESLFVLENACNEKIEKSSVQPRKKKNLRL